jgi:hypothetical protein
VFDVLHFFETDLRRDDPLHKELSKIPGYKGRLDQIRQESLGCCGPEVGNGKDAALRLVVIDAQRWDALQEERASILERLAKLDSLVAQLDKILSEAEEAGHIIKVKTPTGIRAAEVLWRRDHPAPNRFDPFTNKLIKTPPNPQLKRAAEQAEALWDQYVSSVQPATPEPAPKAAPGLFEGVNSLAGKIAKQLAH